MSGGEVADPDLVHGWTGFLKIVWAHGATRHSLVWLFRRDLVAPQICARLLATVVAFYVEGVQARSELRITEAFQEDRAQLARLSALVEARAYANFQTSAR